MSIGFPKKGASLDIVGYYRLTEAEQKEAKSWLEQHGSALEKSLFSQVEQSIQQKAAELAAKPSSEDQTPHKAVSKPRRRP